MSTEPGFDPALYDRFPTAPQPDSQVEELEKIWATPRGWAAVTIVNNNYVGLWYVATAFLFFLLAGVLALLMRTQLALP
jgi:cytochrome c oxidase subunit I+III